LAKQEHSTAKRENNENKEKTKKFSETFINILINKLAGILWCSPPVRGVLQTG
jgi:hypothetical protein